MRKIGIWIECHPLAAVLLVGLALRLIAINSRSLQYDDTFSIFLAARSLPEILSGTAADTMPPLYYFLLHFWMFAGQSAGFIRLLTVILSLAAVAILFHLVQRWFGRTAAAWAALFAAISPLMIYHGQDVRMYALLVVAQLGYLWFFTRIWFEDSAPGRAWMNWAGFVLCGAAAMYSHNVAVFALVVPNLLLLLRRRWMLLGRLILAQLLIGLLAAPWLLLIPGQIAKVQKAWTLPRPGPVELVQVVIVFVASLPLPGVLMVIALALGLLCLVILGLELWRERRNPSGLDFWLIFLLLPPALLFIASYIVKPIFIPRAFLASSLAYDALAGLIVARAWSRGGGKILAAVIVLAAAISLPSFYTYNEFPRSPYQQAAQYLQGVAQPGDNIVHETKLSYFPAHFYAPSLPQVFLADPAGSPNDTFEIPSQHAMQIFPQKDLAAAVSDQGDIYFLTFSQTFREYQAMGYSDHPNVRWLDEHFKRVDRKVFSDLEIYHYQR